MTDNTIIKKLKMGNEEGFSQLLDQYAAYVGTIVFNVSRGYLRPEDVEEVAADVFIAIWNSADRLKEGGSLKAYIGQTARNMAVDRLRKEKQEFLPLDEDVLQFQREEGLDELAVRREQQQVMNRALENLPEPDREIFLRFYYLGEKVKQIGDWLELNPATVKTKLHRSRKKLKEVFEERGYQYEG